MVVDVDELVEESLEFVDGVCGRYGGGQLLHCLLCFEGVVIEPRDGFGVGPVGEPYVGEV